MLTETATILSFSLSLAHLKIKKEKKEEKWHQQEEVIKNLDHHLELQFKATLNAWAKQLAGA